MEHLLGLGVEVNRALQLGHRRAVVALFVEDLPPLQPRFRLFHTPCMFHSHLTEANY